MSQEDLLPPEIKQLIVDFSSTETKFSLRQSNHQFHNLVDKSTIHYRSVEIFFNNSNKSIEIELEIELGNSKIVIFTEHSDGFVQRIHGRSEEKILKGCYIEAAVEMFLKIFRRNVHSGTMIISIDDKDSDLTERILKQLDDSLDESNTRISVTTVSIPCSNASFIRHLTPGTLEYISLTRGISHDSLERICTTEQWKQAKRLEVEGGPLRMEKKETEHFEEVVCFLETLTVDDVKEILEKVLCKNGWKSRRISHKLFLNPAILAYFQSNWPKIEGTVTGNHFRIRADHGECEVEISEYQESIIFTKVR